VALDGDKVRASGKKWLVVSVARKFWARATCWARACPAKPPPRRSWRCRD